MADFGPHDLVISQGDCELSASCTCGMSLGQQLPEESFDRFAVAWERHVRVEHRGCGCEVCSW